MPTGERRCHKGGVEVFWDDFIVEGYSFCVD